METPVFDTMGIDEALKRLQSDPERGLSSEEAAKRLLRYGPNAYEETEQTLWQRISRRLWGPIPWMIEIAALLSLIAQKWEDLIIILILLLTNVLIDLFQEGRALNALKILKQKSARSAIVLRDGFFKTVPGAELVPGDIVKIKIGDIVPADVKLIRGTYLQLDLSSLTGESLPVTKTAGEIGYANAVVKKGEMVALVTGTGEDTYFGKTVALVARAEREERSHFQKAILHVGNFLIALSTVLITVIVITSLFRGDPFSEIIRFAMVLMIASIPVALPAVLSVTMAIGALNLARKQAVVRRLVAIEELAGVDILCSDKTGTLTQNRMSLAEPILYGAFQNFDLLHYAVLASKRENQDPLEMPLFEAYEHLKKPDSRNGYQLQEFIPFDPVQKRTEATYTHDGQTIRITKGAPQVIASLCPNDDSASIDYQVESLARQGYRTIAVAVAYGDKSPYRFVGLIPLFDPPRDDAKETIHEAKKLGLSVKMITGDNLAIARQIANLLAVGDIIFDARELKGDTRKELLDLSGIIASTLYKKLGNHSDAEIERFSREVVKEVETHLSSVQLPSGYAKRHESEIISIIENADGFAQVFPEDKFMIVEKLQKNGHIVAMTGDGVNDAPALKKADAGIAVSGATDAARAAADVILLSPGLSVVVNAIKEARMTFERMQSYSIFRIAETIRIVCFMTLSILIFNFYPITAVMIILLALLNDVPILTIAYDNAKVAEQPIRWNMKEVLVIATVLGLLGLASSFILFYFLETHGLSRDLIQAIIFLKLDVAGHATIYLARTGPHPFWHRPYPSWKLFSAVLSTRIIGTVIAVYGFFMEAIGWEYAAYIWLYATAWFFFNDLVKVAVYRLLHKNESDVKGA